MKKGDLVITKLMPHGPLGIVIRVARDGAWADVRWTAWCKRMRQKALLVLDPDGIICMEAG